MKLFLDCAWIMTLPGILAKSEFPSDYPLQLAAAIILPVSSPTSYRFLPYLAKETETNRADISDRTEMGPQVPPLGCTSRWFQIWFECPLMVHVLEFNF